MAPSRGGSCLAAGELLPRCSPGAAALLLLRCWLASRWLPAAWAEPFPGNTANCISGEFCVVAGLAGTGLSDGDRMMLLQGPCGSGPKTPGMPGNLGESMAASSNGASLRWSEVITADGGSYHMCWCSVAGNCGSFDGYSVLAGTMTITGPLSGMSVTCVGGQYCTIAGIQGTNLNADDSVMILSFCGGDPVDGFPNGAKTSAGVLGGTELGWGQDRIRATGGFYAMCWCAKEATCLQSYDHMMPLGQLTVIGPDGTFTQVCSVFDPCVWAGLSGIGLQNGDRIMLLPQCGVGPKVVGFPNSDIAVASQGGGTYAFGDSDNVVVAAGADYAMCWCGLVTGGVCTGPLNFLVRAGTLTMRGPRTDHQVGCVRGDGCAILSFRGVGLEDGDQVKILLQCGVASAPGSTSVATNGGTTFQNFTSSITGQYAILRICWCKSTWDCTNVASFKMDAGALLVSGVDPGQSRSCHVMDGCQVDNITGTNVRAGGLMMILSTCGGGDAAKVPGWPQNGISAPASNGGQTFSWGVSARVGATPGVYKMCWCPANYYRGCTDPSSFAVEVGPMLLRGPYWLGVNATCTANQDCVAGPFDQGAGLSYGIDRVILVKSTGTCGVDSPDPFVGGNASKLVADNGLVTWPAAELPYGGVWLMCYCAQDESLLDSDAQVCSSPADFPAQAGLLTVGGAYPAQTANCTRGEVCSIKISGRSLNKDTDRLAVRDSSSTCGSSARIPKDLPGNPYIATSAVSDQQIIFTVGPIENLTLFYLCFCVPMFSMCQTTTLADYRQTIGFLDVRGASPRQTFQCGRGGLCSFVVRGRGLKALDFIKIVNLTSNCTAPPVTDGFFRSQLSADPTTLNASAATFSLGRVTAPGSYYVCYCASLGGCDQPSQYNHIAGILSILDPLIDLSVFSATAASVTVAVTSRISGTGSIIRCAAAQYEPRYVPTGADIAAGLGIFGLGKGQATATTVNGTNFVEIFFKSFVQASQQYRVWCVETSAQSFILPGNAGGILIVTPAGITPPRLRTFPVFLWPQASFYAELDQVYDSAINRSQGTTLARLGTNANEVLCNRMAYEDASTLSIIDPGKPGMGNIALLTTTALQASTSRRYGCFFAGPNATGIAMISDVMTVQSDAPQFSPRRLDGLVTTNVYRGVLTQMLFQGASSSQGLIHWTTFADFQTKGCSGVLRAPPDAQVVSGSNTSFFRIDQPTGRYQLCYLGRMADSSTIAPFNGIGDFQLVEAVPAIRQSPALPSTRNTLRLQIEVRVPGTVACIVRDIAASTTADDFRSGALFQGRATLAVQPPPLGVDPEFPQQFDLTIPLVTYQRSGDPMHVWCRHSEADQLVIPSTNDGVVVPLQAAEAIVTPTPTFLWTGAWFKVTFANTPAVPTKYVVPQRPALPAGWHEELDTDPGTGALVLRYATTGIVVDQHPVYTAWLQDAGADPCEGANFSAAALLSGASYTQTQSWFRANATSPFMCYWESADGYPHPAGVLNISAQPPQFQLEVSGQLLPFVYRGVGVNIRLMYIPPTKGRVLVVRKAVFNKFGGACQDLSTAARLLSAGARAPGARAPPAAGLPPGARARLPKATPRPTASRSLQASSTSGTGNPMVDIDRLGIGALVPQEGLVTIPALQNGTGSFLHTDPLGEYVLCYVGVPQELPRVFNPIGVPFSSRDVLSGIGRSVLNQSDSSLAFVNVTSELRGRIRCIALLRNAFPPAVPSDVFEPDIYSYDYLGSSQLIQYDVARTSQVVPLDLDPTQAKLIVPSQSFVGAPPTMYVWCAHEASTVIYPNERGGFLLDIQARPPPHFIYKQANQTISSMALTLQLEFTPIVIEWTDADNFPVNSYDTVRFVSRPAMPAGITLDSATGSIQGNPVPTESGTYALTITAASINPPYGSTSLQVTIFVQDVLGLVYRFANAESILLTVRPRVTTIFEPKIMYLLTQRKVKAFTGVPDEFFCVGALQGVAYTNDTLIKCSFQAESCCCASFINPYLPRQDVRLTLSMCQFQQNTKYQTAGTVEGYLRSKGNLQLARLRSDLVAQADIPAPAAAQDKKPVIFNIVLVMSYSEYTSKQAMYNDQLKNELAAAIDIPTKLVRIISAERQEWPASRRLQQAPKQQLMEEGVNFMISFEVEARCLQTVSEEIKMLSSGIDTQEGCNDISPEQYMLELKAQLSDSESALFYRGDLQLLRKASAARSFATFRVRFFCSKEPLWEYGAVADSEDKCPFDMVKLGCCAVIGGTTGLLLVLAILSQITHEIGACPWLAKVRTLDLLTPLLALYTTVADYGWMAMLKMNAVHPVHNTIFMISMCHLFLCFCVNAVSLRITITSYIMDTPWWRRNRKRLRTVLFLTCLTPRFIRVTRANLFGLDQTHIHFGTPSKMAVVFSNLGMVMMFQDVPQLLLQLYVWLIWRHQGPKLDYVCFVLGVLSFLTALMHHVFSRSQRAAYERVVKLLGVRRLTAGFFDVSAAVGQPATSLGLENMRRAAGAGAGKSAAAMTNGGAGNATQPEEVVDPSKLDPIQAAMYVAQMYEKEMKAQAADQDDEVSDGSSSAGGDGPPG